MADERLRCGDAVRVIGPAATSTRDTFAIGKETTVAELRVDDDGHTVYACQIRGWGFVAFPRASLERLDAAAQAADEPRAIVRAFALAMERKLAVRDENYGSWRQSDLIELMDALLHQTEELRAAWVMQSRHSGPAQDVLMEAVDVAAYAMFIADVCGALPPTDERGR